MKIMLNHKRVPELRRKLMSKLMEMFEPDTTFEYKEVEHFRKNGSLDSVEKTFVVTTGGKEVHVKKNDFLAQTELAKIFHLEPGKECKSFINAIERRGQTTLADLVEILIKTKVFIAK